MPKELLRRTTVRCALMLLAAGILAGCGEGSEKVDPGALESAFKDAPTEPAPAAKPEESTTEAVVLTGGAGDVPVKEVANRAAAAMRKDDLNEAMVLLQTLRRARNLRPEQLTAVQDQMAALQADLANRAAGGDAKAKQALQLIQQSTRW